jgi:glycosyltransferase involved in cell wall biosynthesis
MLPRIPTSPPIIKPVDTGLQRPQWSVMIPAYNCSQYLPETLESVLAQQIPERDMQIEVVDDCSTDADVEAIVNRIGKGRIKYFRQQKNVGSLRNFETCLNHSKGMYVHLLHGDDRIKTGYYKKMENLISLYPDAAAAFCRYNYIDENGEVKFPRTAEMKEDGIIENWLPRIAEACSVQYASIVVKREVYEELGGFFGLIYGEDWEMWVRIAQKYSFAYTPQILAEYRLHSNSITTSKFLDGGIMKDTRQVIEAIKKYLPNTQRKKIIRRAKRRSAFYGLQIAREIWERTRNIYHVNANIKQVISMWPFNKSIYTQIIKLYFSILISTLGRDKIKANAT